MRPSIRVAPLALALVAGCGEQVRIESGLSDGSFTSADGENRVSLRARLPGRWRSAEVTWAVERGIGDTWSSIEVAPGAETELPISTPSGTKRYRAPHPASDSLKEQRLERQRLRYRVVAIAHRGDLALESDTLVLEQSPIAAIRQEYLDIGLRRGAPPPDWFHPIGDLPEGLSYGDFEVGAVNPDFMERLGRLEAIWRNDYELSWQVNSYFRNPAHNRFHVGGGGSGPVSNSWHQFGCAADLQTFPVLRRGRSRAADSARARAFWNALAQEALALEFEVEPRDKNPARPGASFSGVGHVHLEVDCLP